MITFLVLNGPNINMLGKRQPDIYGSETYQDLVDQITDRCKELGIHTIFFQSNHEGDLVDAIQESQDTYDGIIFNPAAYTHTSIALYDALTSVTTPCIEVHISDPDQREEFRRVNFVRPGCKGTVAGKGRVGYLMAVEELIKILMRARGVTAEELLGIDPENDEDEKNKVIIFLHTNPPVEETPAEENTDATAEEITEEAL